MKPVKRNSLTILSVFSILHYRSAIVGALLASSLILSALILSMLMNSHESGSSAVDSLLAPSAGSGSSRMPILRPNTCPHVSKTSAFDKIYDKAEWGGPVQNASDFYSDAAWPPKKRGSASGPGSDLGYATQVSMQVLQGAIRRYNIRTMIDVPCGDANWIFDSLETDTMELYIGLDIVKRLVEVNAARLAHHSNKIFRHWDGAKCPFPKIVQGTVERAVDLVHARDVLQHLPLPQGIQFLCHVFQSGARVFVTTSFLGSKTNKAIHEGDFFHNDLTGAPFNLPAPKDNTIVTCTLTHPTMERDHTCVYDLTQPWVADWIVEKKCDASQLQTSVDK
jgi:hypothetical protein